MKEQYQPSAEELKKAESMMANEQRESSERREKDYDFGEKKGVC